MRGCLPIGGIIDLHDARSPPGGLEERVYKTVLAHAEQDVAMSPVNHTQGNRVPFSINVGTLACAR